MTDNLKTIERSYNILGNKKPERGALKRARQQWPNHIVLQIAPVMWQTVCHTFQIHYFAGQLDMK